MTENDKKLFDEIFYSDKHFKNISEIDMLRSGRDCHCLYEWMQEELAGKAITVSHYMHFAYWLGVILERNGRGEQ